MNRAYKILAIVAVIFAIPSFLVAFPQMIVMYSSLFDENSSTTSPVKQPLYDRELEVDMVPFTLSDNINDFRIMLPDKVNWDFAEYPRISNLIINETSLPNQTSEFQIKHQNSSKTHAGTIDIVKFEPNTFDLDTNVNLLKQIFNEKGIFQIQTITINENVKGFKYYQNECEDYNYLCQKTGEVRLRKNNQTLFVLHGWGMFDSDVPFPPSLRREVPLMMDTFEIPSVDRIYSPDIFIFEE